MSAPKKPSARTLRRAAERATEKLARDRDRLASLEDGGAPEHPITVESASQVEVHARSFTCTRCSGAYRVDEHTAETIGSARLRVARMKCISCGARRSIYFRLAPPLVH